MNNNYLIQPIAITQDKRLTPLEQDYLCLIASLQKAGNCIASNNYFSKYFNIDIRKVKKIISSLKRKGIVVSNLKYCGKEVEQRTLYIADDNIRKCLLSGSDKMSLGGSAEKGMEVVPKCSKGSAKTCPDIINNIIKNNNTYSPNSEEFELACLLLNLILQRKPDFKEPNLQQWSRHIDLKIRSDNRNPQTIKAVIEWCQSDNFWQNNILSTDKLRKQFDRLELRMKSKCRDNSPASRMPKLSEELERELANVPCRI